MFLRRILPLVLAGCTAVTAALLAAPVPAVPKADDTTKKPKVEAAATPAAATPAAPKKPSLLKRLFGGGKSHPAATPAAATPAPTPAKRRPLPRKPADDDNAEEGKPEKPGKGEGEKAGKPEKPESPDESGKPEKKNDSADAEAKPVPPATPAPGGKKGGKKGAPVAATPPPKPLTKEQQDMAKAEASGDSEAVEKAKYDEVKSRAAGDEHVKELRTKADDATSNEEGRKALRAYNKALFQKMRSLDPSIQNRVDKMEAAVMKQIDKEP